MSTPVMACRSVRRLLLVAVMMVLFYGWATSVRGFMHDAERRHLRQQALDMFYHGYRNYMEHAYPWDELKPLSCAPRRWDKRERGDLDDVLGGYSLTLIDSLDMLAIAGDREEFKRAVQLVAAHVTVDRDVTVSVFESTIRVVGGLISAHMLASPDFLGVLTADEYDGELLSIATDLGHRLLPAFDTPTGIPMHRVNLQYGTSRLDAKTRASSAVTCPAAAGSLLVELSYLSRLTGDPVFERKARVAVEALWERRSSLDLLGSSIHVDSGKWVHAHVGIGAGLDSFFEYLLKYHLVSGDMAFLQMFNQSYAAVETHINHDGFHIEVDMNVGRNAVRTRRISALQAFWPGLQVLAGDVSSAIRSHEKLFALWDKFGAMPELFDLAGEGVISWARSSPLRPELIESTYHLYQATRDHRYLKIGRKLLEDMQRVSKVDCGYAAIGNIYTLAVEDRMDSYFLSETVKYLYLLFSDDPNVIVPPMLYSKGVNTSLRANSSSTNNTCKSNLRGVEADGTDKNAGSRRRSQPDNIGEFDDAPSRRPVTEDGDDGSSGCSCRVADPSQANTSTIAGATVSPASSSRALKASDVVFSTEGHILPLYLSLFRHDGSASSQRRKSSTTTNNPAILPWCENGKTEVAKHNADLAPALERSVIQVGVSVRREDSHVMTLVASPASFGPSITSLGHIEAPLALFSREIGEACAPLSRALCAEVKGKLVMVTRGTCSFSEKALVLQDAGAVGAIVINSKTSKAKHPDRKYVVTDDAAHHGQRVTIPVVLVSREDAATLHRNALVISQASLVDGGDDEGDEDDTDTPLTASLSPWLY